MFNHQKSSRRFSSRRKSPMLSLSSSKRFRWLVKLRRRVSTMDKRAPCVVSIALMSCRAWTRSITQAVSLSSVTRLPASISKMGRMTTQRASRSRQQWATGSMTVCTRRATMWHSLLAICSAFHTPYLRVLSMLSSTCLKRQLARLPFEPQYLILAPAKPIFNHKNKRELINCSLCWWK